MDTLLVVIVALVAGALLSVVTGNPLMFLIAIVAGAIAANRLGYRHQARAIKSELQPAAPPPAAPPPAAQPPRDVGSRLAELDRLVAEGRITEAEAADKRKALINEL